MDENFNSAEIVQQPDEQIEATIGKELYEQYENGESIEEINESIAKDSEANAQQYGDDKPYRTYQSHDEFQRDVDKMIGKRLYETKRNEDRLRSQVSDFLGVPKNDLEDFLTHLSYQREAEMNGIVDTELYAQNKIMEQQLMAAQTQYEVRDFLDNVDLQVNRLRANNPNFDMDRYVDNPTFCRVLKTFHDNPETAHNAVELAYRTVFFDEIARNITMSETDKLVSSIRAGASRISEGAVNRNTPAKYGFDPSKLSSKQFDDIVSRVKSGERIMLG